MAQGGGVPEVGAKAPAVTEKARLQLTLAGPGPGLGKCFWLVRGGVGSSARFPHFQDASLTQAPPG